MFLSLLIYVSFICIDLFISSYGSVSYLHSLHHPLYLFIFRSSSIYIYLNFYLDLYSYICSFILLIGRTFPVIITDYVGTPHKLSRRLGKAIWPRRYRCLFSFHFSFSFCFCLSFSFYFFLCFSSHFCFCIYFYFSLCVSLCLSLCFSSHFCFYLVNFTFIRSFLPIYFEMSNSFCFSLPLPLSITVIFICL